MALIIFKTVDAATLQPLGNVSLSGLAQSVQSNACGDAITDFIGPGHYAITFRKAGYFDRVLPADLADPGIITVGLDRTFAPIPPDPPVPPVPPISGPMPNRKNEVKMVCDLHPEAFPYVFDPAHPEKPGVTDDELNAARFHLLINDIIPTLNALDGGGWGLLKKKDQSNKIPVDIACWWPGDHYADVMTGTGANWQPLTNPKPGVWIWTAA